MMNMKIQVTIKPNAKKNEVVRLEDGTYRVAVKAPPVEGKANAGLIDLLADYFSKPKSSISIARGLKGKKKTVEIS